MDNREESRKYGEDIGEEVVDMMMDIESDPDLWKKVPWAERDIMKMYVDVELLFNKPVIDDKDLLRLAIEMGDTSFKLDLTGTENTIPTLIHTLGLLKYAIHLMHEGKTIHILEGCDGTGARVTHDIDLIYHNGDEFIYVDYTQKKHAELVVTVSESNAKEKYGILRDSCPEGSTCVVMSFHQDLDRLYNTRVEFSTYNGSGREKEMMYADRIMELSHQMTLDEAEVVLCDYADKMSSLSDDRSGMVQTPPKVVKMEVADAFMNSSGRNGHKEALLYEDIQRRYHANKACHKYYSTRYYDKVLECEAKEPVEIEPALRGCNLESPFERLEAILQKNRLKGEQGSALLALFLLCKDDAAHPTEEDEMDYERYIDGDFWYGATVQRMTDKGELSSVVKIRFPEGKSWKQYQLYQKSGNWCSRKNSYSYSHLEDYVERGWMEMVSTSTGSYITDDTNKMIDDVMPDSHLADKTRKIMSGTFNLMKDTLIMSCLGMKQELTMAILNTGKKKRFLPKKLGGFKSQEVVVSLDTVGDRYAVVMSNTGPICRTLTDDAAYMVFGVFSAEKKKLIRRTHSGLSYTFCMNRSQMDWNIAMTQRATSWFTLSAETLLSTQPNLDKIEYLKLSKMPLLIMFTNSNKFSQAAEQVRYLFVNGSGLCSAPESLYDKISWYTPQTYTERLYMLRTCRMADLLNTGKAWNSYNRLKIKVGSHLVETRSATTHHRFEEWNLAMPDEETASLSSQHIFNSFYTCRAMTMQRYNKTTSEAMVLKKQLDAREEYIKVKSENRQHEARFQDLPSNVEELKETFLKTDYVNANTGPYSACFLTVTLGFLSTMLMTSQKESSDTKIGSLLKAYDLDGVCRTLNIKDVMNTRGSVRESGKHGVTVLNIQQKDKKKIAVTQNSKCYMTILLALQHMVQGKTPPEVFDDWEDEEPDFGNTDSEPLDISKLLNMSDKLWPLLFWYNSARAQFVSKMVHKDQIGAREIAVLNAAARVMCYYIEMLARKIRDVEHLKLVKTNLIERKDKMELISRTLSKAIAEKHMGRMVLFDSADCSKWGPSMMYTTLYLAVCLRMRSCPQKTLARNAFSLFGMKVFKIPDNFYDRMPEFVKGENVISEVRRRLLSMTPEMGSYKHQLLRLEESMHQGILGCSSSVLGSDAQNLTKFVLERLYKAHDFKITSHITSDDYSRVLSWNEETTDDYLGMFGMAKQTLAIHVGIMSGFGIKRNMQKSSMSSTYWEFNSEYFTPSGEMRPDIKSRLSYVDYGHSVDPYPNALRCVTQTSEFLRAEGSFVGSCWIGLLNNQLAMYQNQSGHLYRLIGKGIYEVPLELGGLVRVDPLLDIVSFPLLPLLHNYRSTPEDSIQKILSIMKEGESVSPHLVETLTDGSKNNVKVPSLSRSGCVHRCSRPNRSSRAIREFLMSLDPESFSRGFHGKNSSQIMLSLIACAHREESEISNESSSMRYSQNQTVSSIAFYMSNSNLVQDLVGKRKFSRKDMHDAAVRFLENRSELSYPLVDNLNTAVMEVNYKIYKGLIKRLKPFECSPVPRVMHNHTRIEDYTNSGYVDEVLDKYDREFKPTCLGGMTDVHPWIFLECRTTLASRTRKLSRRKQVFRMRLNEGDEYNRNIMEQVLLSNYMAGCRLAFDYRDNNDDFVHLDTRLVSSIKSMENMKVSKDGVTIELMAGRFPNVCAKGLIQHVDLTSYLNMMLGSTDITISDINLRKRSAECIMNMSEKHPDLFVIRPHHIKSHFPSINYSSSKRVKLWQKPVLDYTGKSVGREFTHQSGDTYNHTWMLFTGHMEPPSDTRFDHYDVAPYHTLDYLSVRVHEHYGYLVTSAASSGNLIQVLLQSPVKKTKITLKTNEMLEADIFKLRDYGVTLDVEMNAPQAQDIFNLSVGFRSGSGWKDEQEEMKVAEDDTMEDLRTQMNDEDSESDFEYDNDDFMADFMSRADVETSGVYEEPDDSDSEDDQVIEVVTNATPVSEQGVLRPSSGYLVKLAKGAVTRKMVRRNPKERPKFRHEYVIDVPMDFDTKVFEDDDSGDAIDHLFSHINSLDAADAIWAKQYLLESLSSYGPISANLELLFLEEHH